MGGTLGGAITIANNAKNKANEAITKVDNLIISTTIDKADTSNDVLNTSSVITTRINNLNSGSVSTVANVFPLLYNSHFKQMSDELSPNKISNKNIHQVDLIMNFLKFHQ